jgi:hypothetical protein
VSILSLIARTADFVHRGTTMKKAVICLDGNQAQPYLTLEHANVAVEG